VPMRATGTFEVKLTPQASNDASDTAGAAAPSATTPALSRMTLDKHFRGELQAVSKGEMLAVRTDVQGSAGYVAIEQVSGTLHDRSGAFILQHSGTMTRGVPQLTITVVPDSGTGELVGLAGRMSINIADAKHSYDFEYTLPETA
jgi:hypothetical protein